MVGTYLGNMKIMLGHSILDSLKYLLINCDKHVNGEQEIKILEKNGILLNAHNIPNIK